MFSLFFGQKKMTLPRKPIAIYCIFSVYLAFYLVPLFTREPVSPNYEIAHQLFVTHPGILLPPRLEEMIELDHPDAEDWHRKPTSQTTMTPEIQARFDHFINLAFDEMDSTPTFFYSYIPMKPRLHSFLTHIFFLPNGDPGSNFFFLLIPAGLTFTILYYLLYGSIYLENYWGTAIYATFFLVAGMVSALLFGIMYPDTWTPWSGPIPVISALTGAFMFSFRKASFEYDDLGSEDEDEDGKPTRGITLAVWYVVFSCFVIAMLMQGQTGYPFIGIPILLIMFVLGGMTAYLLEVKGLTTMCFSEPIKEAEKEKLNQTLMDLKNRDTEDYLDALADAWRADPTNHEFRAAYWNQAVRMDRAEEALDAGEDYVVHLIQNGDYDDALFHWIEFTQIAPGSNVAPVYIEHLVTGLLQAGNKSGAQKVMAYTFEYWPPDLKPSQRATLLDTARFADPHTTYVGINKLLDQPGLNEPDRSFYANYRDEVVSLYPQVLEPKSERLEIEISPDPYVVPSDPRRPHYHPAPFTKAQAPDPEQPIGKRSAKPKTPERPAPPPIPEQVSKSVPTAAQAKPIPFQAAPPPEDPSDDLLATDIVTPTAISELLHALVLPQAITQNNMTVEILAKGKMVQLSYREIRAIAIGVIRQPEKKGVLVLDLLQDFPFEAKPLHRILRVTSPPWDPSKLVPNQKPMEVLRQLVKMLLERGGAYPLPSLQAVTAARFNQFPTIEAFEQATYGHVSTPTRPSS